MPLPDNLLIRQNIYSYLPLYNLLCLAWTSKTNRVQVCAYIVYRMRMQLATYVPDVHAFLAALDHSGGIVAGSAALHLTVAEREAAAWRARTLKVYVPRGGELLFIAYLVGQGFAISSSRYVESHGTKVIKNYTQCGQTIKMIVSTSNSPLFPMVHAQSTLLMTYYTQSTVFIAYPSLTFQRRGIANPLSTNDEDPLRWRCHVPSTSVFGVYNDCGFRLQTSTQSRSTDILQGSITHTCYSSASCAMTKRNSEDRDTLSIILVDNRTETGAIGDVVQWRIGGRRCQLGSSDYEASFAKMLSESGQ